MFRGKAREVRLRRFVLKTDREDVKRKLRMELPDRRFRGRPERRFRDMIEDKKEEMRMQRTERWRQRWGRRKGHLNRLSMMYS